MGVSLPISVGVKWGKTDSWEKEERERKRSWREDRGKNKKQSL